MCVCVGGKREIMQSSEKLTRENVLSHELCVSVRARMCDSPPASFHSGQSAVSESLSVMRDEESTVKEEKRK